MALRKFTKLGRQLKYIQGTIYSILKGEGVGTAAYNTVFNVFVTLE